MTLVYDALCEGSAAARFGPLKDFGRKIVRDVAWDLSGHSFAPGVVYRTHALASEVTEQCAKGAGRSWGNHFASAGQLRRELMPLSGVRDKTLGAKCKIAPD